jgi:hypothetical protein
MSEAPPEHTPSLHRIVSGTTLAGGIAVLLWTLFCVAWFDVAAPWRPKALAVVPPLALLPPALLAAVLWLRGRWAHLAGGSRLGPERADLLLVLALAFFFRLPIVAAGAAATVTPDGALSGIVALHARDGVEHLVFVPHVPYSGSLKSHLTAPLALLVDPPRAFALVSVLFYLGYVACLFRLGLVVGGRRAGLLAGLYAAFSPAFLTRYSLSNDGNYVEVLALGTCALWLGARWTREPAARPTLALAIGLLLGLAFWCHILAVIHLAALVVVLVVVARRRSPASLLALGWGWAVGYVPGLLWNAAHGWESFHYLLPGEARAGETGAAGVSAMTSGLGAKLVAMVTDQWPVLMGYDTGYGPRVDRLFLAIAWIGVLAALVAGGYALLRALRERSWPLGTLLVFATANLAIALLALPHVEGNPRYILFLMSVVPVLLAMAFGAGWRRLVLLLLVATGAVASFAQVPGTLRSDSRWRGFVSALEKEGVRWCYTDFYLATRINFISGEKVVCSAKLGPTTTEYFFAYRREVDAAPEAAIVAVNRTSAGRMERRLRDLGVTYERLDLMKPVLLRLSRKVDPSELFPGREFPLR